MGNFYATVYYQLREMERSGECSFLHEQTGKTTIVCTYEGCKVDIHVAWAEKNMHGYVAFSRALCRVVRAHPNVKVKWLEVLAQSRTANITQPRGATKGRYLKIIVLNIIIAAALDYVSQRKCIIITPSNFITVVRHFIPILRGNTLKVGVSVEGEDCTFQFSCVPKPVDDDTLMVVNDAHLDVWHGSNCASNVPADFLRGLITWIESLDPNIVSV